MRALLGRCITNVFAELGSELPGRIRGTKSVGLLTGLILAAAGRVLELVSPIWSDTEVYHFELVENSK